MDVGQKIKEIRRMSGMNQKKLADEINKSTSTLKKYENGEVAITVDVLMDIAEVLEVNPCVLLGVEKLDLIDLIKDEYGITTNNENLLRYDIDTYLKYLKMKHSNLQ